MARKSRTGGQLVQRARPKTARVDLDLAISNGGQCRLELPARGAVGPARELLPRQLHARLRAEMSNSEVAGHAERAQRRFGFLDASKTRNGYRRAVRDAGRKAR